MAVENRGCEVVELAPGSLRVGAQELEALSATSSTRSWPWRGRLEAELQPEPVGLHGVGAKTVAPDLAEGPARGVSFASRTE